jgi:cytochrome b6-f complex iron-sulfur subunit
MDVDQAALGEAGRWPAVTRRTALVGGVAAVGAVAALAGCSSSSSGGSPAASGGSPAASTGAGSGALAKLADVPVGGAVAAQAADGSPIIVAQPTAGNVVAFTAVCTHMGCTVKPAGKELDCPCHGSKYDAFTGKVLGGPAPAPLAPVPVKVSGADVVSG